MSFNHQPIWGKELVPREQLHFDVVIVGAGPAGLSSAIRLKQLAEQENKELSICVLEKGSQVGAHILSGAVMDSKALEELLPNWRYENSPIQTQVTEEIFYLLTPNRALSLPVPPSLHNHGHYIVSLGVVCRWLSTQAEALGVDIYPGFAGSEVLYENNKVIGVATGDLGCHADGSHTSRYQRGVAILGRQTIFAEGVRGNLSKEVIEHFNLARGPGVYALGIKEIWQIPAGKHHEGRVIHTIGWPLSHRVTGGSFLYHAADSRVYIGYVVALDYQNPYLSPYELFQQYKTHPLIKSILQEGKRLSYGAKAISEGGLQSLPKLSFPGGVLVGDSAGFLNLPRLKGTHTAIKSGILAAEAVWQSLKDNKLEAYTYQSLFKDSWLYQELKSVRNYRPAFRWGLFPGLIYCGLEDYLLKGKGPWTLRHYGPDHRRLCTRAKSRKISYSKHDKHVTFAKKESLYLSDIRHRDDQPCHLKLKNSHLAYAINYCIYDSPETRYCPAGVYEIIEEENKTARLQINAQNCLHCKTCDIKDPLQNIVWSVPEGGDGPNYNIM